MFNRLESTTFEQRVYNFTDEMVQEMYQEAEPTILKKIEEQNQKMGV